MATRRMYSSDDAPKARPEIVGDRLVDHALSFAARGWPIIPVHSIRDGRCTCGNAQCSSPGKHPRTRHGARDGNTNGQQVRWWWEDCPDSNIGIVTGQAGGVFVVDVDPGNGGDESIKALEAEHGALPATVTAATGGGGSHYYFRAEADITNSTSVLGRGLDIKSSGGFVVAPPSLHASGNRYEWVEGRSPDEIEVAVAPDWLVEALTQRRRKEAAAKAEVGRVIAKTAAVRKYAKSALAGEVDRVVRAREGDRNNILNMASFALGQLVAAGVLDRAVVEQALADAAERCGLGEREASATIRSGIDGGMKAPRELPDDLLDDGEIERLARLPVVEYDRQRDEVAKRLGCRVSTLDSAVKTKRLALLAEAEEEEGPSVPEVEPWAHPVDGAELLDDIAAQVSEYVVLPQHAAELLALWCLHTHCFERFDHTPRLGIVSPVMRSGKTQLLNTIQPIVERPLRAANISTAAMFRTIEALKPSLLVDEADSFAGGNDELRGVINAGHERGGQVIRLVGDAHNPRAFSVYSPLAYAVIGRLWATVTDRSVLIRMQRKRKDEKVARLTRKARERLGELGRRCARWAQDHDAELERSDPSVPEALGDREADNWRVLLALADLAGGAWPERARQAALSLSSESGDSETEIIALLIDIRRIFDGEDGKDAIDRITSAGLVADLVAMVDRPWAERNRGKPITAAWLARRLKPLAVWPKQLWKDDANRRGYERAQLEDAFQRYAIAADSADQTARARETAQDCGVLAVREPLDRAAPSALKTAAEARESAAPSGLAVRNGKTGRSRQHRKFVYQPRPFAQWLAVVERYERDEEFARRQREKRERKKDR